MKYLVLGGGGFIGSSISDRLLATGCKVRIFERVGVEKYRKFEETENVEWFFGDFQNPDDLSKALDGVSTVIHLISTTVPKTSFEDPIADLQTNVVATLNLLRLMVEKNVKNIIFLSSGGTVYGLPKYLPIDEFHSTDPIVPYGISKLAIEKYLLLYNKVHDINSIIFRVTNPYGLRQNSSKSQGAIGVFLNHALNNTPITIWGDGEIVRDYLHVSDVTEAVISATKYDGKKNIFNISSGVGVSLNEIIRMIENSLKRKVNVAYETGRSFDIPSNVLKNDLAIKELGWSIGTSLQDGIQETIDWKKNSF